MGHGIARRARSRKPRTGLRALLGRAPDARAAGERLHWLARRMLKGVLVDASPRRITLALHPAASPVRIAVLPDGDLEVTADTARIGPGYHAHVLARLAPILDELDYVWDGDAGDPQVAAADWLAGELRAGATRIAMPPERSFRVAAAVLTPLGPRDEAWRDAVIAEPRRGADAFAWWDTGPGRDARSRALLAMWLELPWREPLDDDERKLMGQVDLDLDEAHRADPGLALPWADWLHLLELLGIDDDARLAPLRERASGRAPAIGYRRHAMDIELSGGWTIELAGRFSGRWEDDGGRWWATDGRRVVEFTSLTANDERDSARLLAVAPEAHAVIERSVDGERHARAEAYRDGAVDVVHGLVAQAPHVAILTCRSEPADQAWALATWRSLRNDG